MRFARYPLEGVRGLGAERATAWGQAMAEHAADANENVFVVPIVETVTGASNLAAMLDVPGVDLFWFGPADYSASAGHRGQWEGAGVAEDLLRMKDAIRRVGKQCGVVATSDDNVRERLSQGFRAVGLGFDAGLLIRSLRNSLAAVGRDRAMRADLSVPPLPAVTPARAVKPVKPFRVAFTADFHDPSGNVSYRDIGLDALVDSSVEVEFFARHLHEIASYQLAGPNGAIVLTPRVTANSLAACPDLLAIGRFGVGYDSVDVPACTAADVLLFIASGAVDRSVAEATIGWMIDLAHHTRTKDRLAREARWDLRSRYMGVELRDRTLGVIGFGGIGRALVKLLDRLRHEAHAGARSVPDRRRRHPLRRHVGTARPAPLRVRLRLDPLPAHRRDARPTRFARTRHDEADGISHQHRSRRHCR